MERPAQRYFCNKCGYVGISDTHPGCQYLAYPMAHLEQLYIDHLEAELEALRASPASAPEGWKLVGLEDLIKTVLDADADLSRGDKNAALIGVRVATSFVSLIKSHVANRKTLAAPTPPSTEDQKDAERYRWLIDNSFDKGITQFHVWKHSWEPHSKTGEQIEWKQRISGPPLNAAIDAAMQEDKL